MPQWPFVTFVGNEGKCVVEDDSNDLTNGPLRQIWRLKTLIAFKDRGS